MKPVRHILLTIFVLLTINLSAQQLIDKCWDDADLSNSTTILFDTTLQHFIVAGTNSSAGASRIFIRYIDTLGNEMSQFYSSWSSLLGYAVHVDYFEASTNGNYTIGIRNDGAINDRVCENGYQVVRFSTTSQQFTPMQLPLLNSFKILSNGDYIENPEHTNNFKLYNASGILQWTVSIGFLLVRQILEKSNGNIIVVRDNGLVEYNRQTGNIIQSKTISNIDDVLYENQTFYTLAYNSQSQTSVVTIFDENLNILQTKNLDGVHSSFKKIRKSSDKFLLINKNEVALLDSNYSLIRVNSYNDDLELQDGIAVNDNAFFIVGQQNYGGTNTQDYSQFAIFKAFSIDNSRTYNKTDMELLGIDFSFDNFNKDCIEHRLHAQSFVTMCDLDISNVIFSVKNRGEEAIDSFNIHISRNTVVGEICGLETFKTNIQTTPILSGETIDITIQDLAFTIEQGAHLCFWVTAPNGQIDKQSSNDYACVSLHQDPNIVDTMGITTLDKEEEIVLFPNPVSQKLTVNLKNRLIESGDVTIYNATGTLVWNKKILADTNRFGIDTQPLAAGVYILMIHTDEALLYSERFVKIE